ncbi:MAG: hypothetical protein ABGW69_01100 [Nanoarchaeota archaeon]
MEINNSNNFSNRLNDNENNKRIEENIETKNKELISELSEIEKKNEINNNLSSNLINQLELQKSNNFNDIKTNYNGFNQFPNSYNSWNSSEIGNLTTFLYNKKNMNENSELKKTNPYFSSIFNLFMFLLVLIASVFFGTISQGILFSIGIGILVLSIFISLIFKKYNLDSIFINLIIAFFFLIFIFNFYTKILFFVLSIILLVYFIYLAVRKTKYLWTGAFLTFLIILYSFTYYFPYVSKLSPYVEKTAQTTSYYTREAVSSSISNTLSSILEKNNVDTFSFLNYLSPSWYQKVLEEQQKQEAIQNELPKIGEYSNIKLVKIVTPNGLTNSIDINNYKGKIALGFEYNFDKDYLLLLKSFKLPNNYYLFYSIVNCSIRNDEDEYSGICKLNNRKNGIIIKKDIRNYDFDHTLNINSYFEVYSKENNLKIKNKFYSIQLAGGAIENNKDIKAIQFKLPLSISLKFVKIKDENSYYYTGYLYLTDLFKEKRFMNDDILPTTNYITNIKEVFLCFDKLNGKDNIIDKVHVYLEGNDYDAPIINLIEGLECFNLSGDIYFGNQKSILPIQVDIYPNKNIDLRYYIVNFYIIVPFEYEKDINLNINSKFPLLPFVYFNNYESDFMTDKSKFWEIFKEIFNLDDEKKENFLLAFDKINPNVDFEINDLKDFPHKKNILKLLVLGYFYNNYKMNQLAICNDLNLSSNNCSWENINNKMNEIINKEKEILIDKKKIKTCDLIRSITNGKVNSQLFINFLDDLIKENKNVYSCEDIYNIYRKDTFKDIINLYSKIVNYLIAKDNPFLNQ